MSSVGPTAQAAGIVVRGAATPEQIAAVVAAVTAASAIGPSRQSGYERWRRTRLEALRTRDR